MKLRSRVKKEEKPVAKPKAKPKLKPKARPKVTPKSLPKGKDKPKSKVAQKSTSKSTPRAKAEATPESTSKVTAKSKAKTTLKATRTSKTKGTPEPTSKAKPRSTSNATSKRAPKKTSKAKPQATWQCTSSRTKSKQKVSPSKSRYGWVWVSSDLLPNKVYQFKITLLESYPLIWRRILVPENYSFWEFHWAIQSAMGWQGHHNHQFEVRDKKTKEFIQLRSPFSFVFDEDDKSPSEKDVKISMYLSSLKDRCGYIYDLGDSWQHVVELEKKVLFNPRIAYPKCIGGERACPPEDCGGVDGFQHLLEVIADPKHEEHQEMTEWLKDSYGRFKPDKFNPNEVVFHGP